MKTYITEAEVLEKMSLKEFEEIVETGDREKWNELASKFVDVGVVLSWERNEKEHYWIVWYHI